MDGRYLEPRVVGCTKVATGCELKESTELVVPIVSRHKASRAALLIVLEELFTTAAVAHYNWINFFGLLELLFESSPMVNGMDKARWHYLKVLRAIVSLVTIYMVNYFALAKWAAKQLISNKPMFVNIATNIGKNMSRHSKEYISLSRNGSAAAPIRITLTRICRTHY